MASGTVEWTEQNQTKNKSSSRIAILKTLHALSYILQHKTIMQTNAQNDTILIICKNKQTKNTKQPTIIQIKCHVSEAFFDC